MEERLTMHLKRVNNLAELIDQVFDEDIKKTILEDFSSHLEPEKRARFESKPHVKHAMCKFFEQEQATN